jgi:hypothetical protein
MRLGLTVAAAPGCSVASSSSMPRSQPATCSLNVARPTSSAKAAQSRARRRRLAEARGEATRISASPDRSRPRPAFVFMIIVLAGTRAMMPVIHARRWPPPMSIPAAPAAVATSLALRLDATRMDGTSDPLKSTTTATGVKDSPRAIAPDGKYRVCRFSTPTLNGGGRPPPAVPGGCDAPGPLGPLVHRGERRVEVWVRVPDAGRSC